MGKIVLPPNVRKNYDWPKYVLFQRFRKIVENQDDDNLIKGYYGQFYKGTAEFGLGSAELFYAVRIALILRWVMTR